MCLVSNRGELRHKLIICVAHVSTRGSCACLETRNVMGSSTYVQVKMDLHNGRASGVQRIAVRDLIIYAPTEMVEVECCISDQSRYGSLVEDEDIIVEHLFAAFISASL